MTAVTKPGSYTEGASAPPIWSKPDPALAAAGIEGELVVARVRVVAIGLLLIAPTWNLIHHHDEPMFVTGFIVTLTAGIAALAFWLMLRRGRWRPWVGFATSAFDVSMVSLALVTFLLVASPMVALNSKVTFEMYFLAIVATSLRYDARICIAIGLLAVCEYAAMWIYAGEKYDLHDPRWIAEAGPYSAVDLATRLILLFIATILAVTIVRRAQRLLYLASRDKLTGLFNRGHFDRTLVGTMDGAARDEQPLALALLDIDHFKQVNDNYGHAQGDRVLVQMADRLARATRRTDMVARYGGEEFVILMPGTSRDAALTAVEELRKEIAAAPIELDQGQQLTLNFSAGISGIPDDSQVVTPKQLVSSADARLLAAKRAGRGRCIGSDILE
jgi:diguanylate cyclase (GGDEF)-like protein